MTYWSLVFLLASILFLASRNPAAMWNVLPQWLRTKEQQTPPVEVEAAHNEKSGNTLGQDHDRQTPTFDVTEPELDPDEDGEGTPKAKVEEPKQNPPTFSLDQGTSPAPRHTESEKPQVPSFPAANSAQRASSMLPPSKPATQKPASSLMPPPAPKPQTLMPPPSRPNPVPNRGPAPSAGLRVPPNGPLPNRGPPVSSQQRAGSSNNGRGKILLSPGHSPMDWAALANGPKSLSGVPTLQRVTPSELKTMTGRKGKPAWSSYQGKVYNITPYLPFHPGGEPELMKGAGRDGGKLFMEIHPWVNWEGMLSSCMVGILVSESEGHSSLDDMD